MIALLLNISLLVIQFLLLFIAMEVSRRFDKWLLAKTNNKGSSRILGTLVFLLILLPLAGFLAFQILPNFFSLLGTKLSPDYFVGPQTYNPLWWFGVVLIPILLYLCFRYTIWRDKSLPEGAVTLPNKIITVPLIIIGVIAIGYTIYIVSYSAGHGAVDQIIEAATGGKPVVNNIYSQDGYTITLYPRNGTWGNQDGYLSLPETQNAYGIKVSTGVDATIIGGTAIKKLENDGQGYSWTIYQVASEQGNPSYDINLKATSEYQGKSIAVSFSYRNDLTWGIKEKAEADFEKMLKSLTFN